MSNDQNIKGLPPVFRKLQSVLRDQEARVSALEGGGGGGGGGFGSFVTIGVGGAFATMADALAENPDQKDFYLLPGVHEHDGDAELQLTFVGDPTYRFYGAGMGQTFINCTYGLYYGDNAAADLNGGAGTYTRAGNVITGSGTDFVAAGIVKGMWLGFSDAFKGAGQVVSVSATQIVLSRTCVDMPTSGNASTIAKVHRGCVEIKDMTFIGGHIQDGMGGNHNQPVQIVENVDNLADSTTEYPMYDGEGGEMLFHNVHWVASVNSDGTMYPSAFSSFINCTFGRADTTYAEATYINCNFYGDMGNPFDSTNHMFIGCRFHDVLEGTVWKLNPYDTVQGDFGPICIGCSSLVNGVMTPYSQGGATAGPYTTITSITVVNGQVTDLQGS